MARTINKNKRSKADDLSIGGLINNIPPLKPKGNSPKTARIVTLIVIVLAAGLFVAKQFMSKRETATVPAVGEAPLELNGFGPEGAGGDPELNKLKNRNIAPKKVVEYTVKQIVAIPHEILDQEGKRRRSAWYPAARLHAEKYESQGAQVTGYIIRVKQSGPESANGYSDSTKDYHIWIADTPEGSKNNSMVVEVTPRWKVVYPEWKLKYFQNLARQKAKVRVTGWLLWDHEHASEVDKSRGTQWEIHPITRFEIFSNGAWRELTGEFANGTPENL